MDKKLTKTFYLLKMNGRKFGIFHTLEEVENIIKKMSKAGNSFEIISAEFDTTEEVDLNSFDRKGIK